MIIYHNPRCRKSREALELLREKGVEPQIVEYLKRPFTEKDLKRLLDLLGMKPRDLIRRQEKDYKELGLKDKSLSEADLIDAMASRPKLVERPIVEDGNRAVLGRPKENILDLL